MQPTEPCRAGDARLGSGARRGVCHQRYRPTVAGAFPVSEPQVSLDPEIRDYARESFPPGRPVLDGAIELMRRIKADFTYEIGATTVTTTPPMSFALRRGVCQDFAHIMISGLRGIGLPAAYVSGYLRTVPRTDADAACRAPTPCMPGCWCGAAQAGRLDRARSDQRGPRRRRPRGAGDRPRLCRRGADRRRRSFASGGQRIDVAVSVTPGGELDYPVLWRKHYKRSSAVCPFSPHGMIASTQTSLQNHNGKSVVSSRQRNAWTVENQWITASIVH